MVTDFWNNKEPREQASQEIWDHASPEIVLDFNIYYKIQNIFTI